MARNILNILQQMLQNLKIMSAHFEMLCINELICIKVAKSRARKISKTHSKCNFVWRQFCSYIFLHKKKSKKNSFFSCTLLFLSQFKLASKISTIYLNLEIIWKPFILFDVTIKTLPSEIINKFVWINKMLEVVQDKQNVR